MKPLAYEKVTLADAKKVHDGAPRREIHIDWTSRRVSGDQGDPLFAATMSWMGELQGDARPIQLAIAFPRIANRICALWNHPVRCGSYLADLLIMRRANRKGFPADVAREIGDLAALHARLFPAGRSWTESR
jgi:hypothetical protein